MNNDDERFDAWLTKHKAQSVQRVIRDDGQARFLFIAGMLDERNQSPSLLRQAYDAVSEAYRTLSAKHDALEESYADKCAALVKVREIADQIMNLKGLYGLAGDFDTRTWVDGAEVTALAKELRS